MLGVLCLCPACIVSVAGMLVQAELAKYKAEADGLRVRVCVPTFGCASSACLHMRACHIACIGPGRPRQDQRRAGGAQGERVQRLDDHGMTAGV